MKKIINTEIAPAPIGPYNQAVLAGGFLYVSGQIPLDAATGQIIEGDITNETAMVMKNIGYILQEAKPQPGGFRPLPGE